MYSENDWRAYELYHHGILGMHWGVQNGPPYPLDSSISTGKRLKGSGSGNKPSMFDKMRKGYYEQQIQYLSGPRYRGETDNEYKMRMKQIDTFQKELDRINGKSSYGSSVDADRIAKSISSRYKQYKGSDQYGYPKTTADCKNDIEKLKDHPKYAEAWKEYEDVSRDWMDYINDHHLVNEYQTLAGMIRGKEYAKYNPENLGQEMAQCVWGYKYEDFDQGTGDSFSVYMLDKGTNIKAYNDRVFSVSDNMDKVRRDVVKEALGNHYDDVLDTYPSGKHLTVGRVVEKALDSDDSVYPMTVEIREQDVPAYRRALKEAKTNYDLFKDIQFNDYDFEKYNRYNKRL